MVVIFTLFQKQGLVSMLLWWQGDTLSQACDSQEPIFGTIYERKCLYNFFFFKKTCLQYKQTITTFQKFIEKFKHFNFVLSSCWNVAMVTNWGFFWFFFKKKVMWTFLPVELLYFPFKRLVLCKTFVHVFCGW